MANPGTAVTSLWNSTSDKKVMMSGSAIKQETVQAMNQDEKFRTFFKEQGLHDAIEESAVPTKPTAVNKVSTMATLVSSLSGLVGTVGTSTNQGMVTFISSRTQNAPPNSTINPTNKTGITQTHPLLLPKPSVPQKQVIGMPATPTKMGYAPNPTVLTSPHIQFNLCTKSPPSAPAANRKRTRADIDSELYDSKRRRTPTNNNRCVPEKGGKGLRHFSMKVCEKVQKKGITSYNEVADELVQEFSEQSMKNPIPSDQSYDQKNIRRRVYDALNVLMAMNIISKEKKEIKWVGLPTNSAQECRLLESQKHKRIERIRKKQQQLKELIVQQIAYKNLVERNKRTEKKNGPPQANACIHLPFIIVNTSKKTVIDCSISSDKSEYLFTFDEAFEIHDDIEVLKRMGLSHGLEKGDISEKNLKVVRNMVPKALEPYVLQMASGTYGDLELIDLESRFRESTASPTELFTGALPSPGPSSRSRNTSRKRNNVTSVQLAKHVQTYGSSSSIGSDYDTDNDGDDENSTVME